VFVFTSNQFAFKFEHLHLHSYRLMPTNEAR